MMFRRRSGLDRALAARQHAAGVRQQDEDESRMVIDERRSGTVLVLMPRGRLDAHSSTALQTRLLGCVGSGAQRVLLDCTGLDYLSSAGLRVLLTASKRLGEHDGKLALCAPSDAVAEILRVSGFDSIFELHADVDTALAALA